MPDRTRTFVGCWLAVTVTLNTDSGVSERVVTLNGHSGLLLDVLYDKDWVSETFSNLNCEIPDEIIMNLFGAALPCLAQIMGNDIHASLNKTEHCSNCPDLRIWLAKIQIRMVMSFVSSFPLVGTEFDHDERIRCAHAARVVENYLDNVAYGKKVEHTFVDSLKLPVLTALFLKTTRRCELCLSRISSGIRTATWRLLLLTNKKGSVNVEFKYLQKMVKIMQALKSLKS